MRKKLLTVSIASYNVENYINETVNSLVVSDEYFDKMEIIIVNDGSSDLTSALSHDLAKKYPNTVRVLDKENGGYGSTINASLAAANGKYYKLLDGDDWFDTKEVPGFMDYLEKCEADIVVSPYYKVRKSDYLIDNHREIPPEAEIIESLPVKNRFFAMHEIAVKTNVLRSCGRPVTEHCFYTDTEFVLFCFTAADTIARYPRPIYRYRLGLDGQSVSLQGIRQHYRDCLTVSERMIQAFTEAEKGASGSKKDVMEFCIQRIVHHTFYSFMLLEDSKAHRGELMAFDQKIKDTYPIAYSLGYRIKLVKLTRLLHFGFYSVLCRLAMRKYEKELAFH